MTAQMFNTAVELRRAILDGSISEMALEAITQIPTGTLRVFLTKSGEGTHGGATSLQPLSADEATRLSVLASQILQGFDIGDDERLQAILEGLTTQFHLTLDNIALLAGLDSVDLAVALRDPSSLPAERRYALALRLSYLTDAIERARPASSGPRSHTPCDAPFTSPEAATADFSSWKR